MSFSKESPPKGVELKQNPDGTENPKYIDLLDEDKSIAGQKFVCLSFISPEHILKQKDMYFQKLNLLSIITMKLKIRVIYLK